VSASASSTSGVLSSSGTVVASGVMPAGSGIAAGVGAGAASGGTVGAKLVTATAIAKWMGMGVLTASSAIFAPDAVKWVQQVNNAESSYEAKLPTVNATVPKQNTPHPTAPITPRPATEPSSPLVQKSVAPKAAPFGHPAATGAAVSVRTVAPSSASADFAGQVEIVEQARHAIAGSDAAGGLQVLADYEQRYTRGQLLPEVLVLRLTALKQLGRTLEAQAVARRILQRGETGVHAQRARAILAE
jgi:hypothetical protein